MAVYGGVETEEIVDLIEDIEIELKSLSNQEFDIGKWEGLVTVYKRLMNMVYVDEYCEKKFKELNI